MNEDGRRRSVVLPVYDERVGVWRGLVDRLLEAGWDEVVIAVDRPTDQTRRVVETLRADRAVTATLSDRRRGKGGALRDGLSATHGDVIGYVDADGAVGVEALDRLYTAVEEDAADVALGSRPPGERDGQSILRRGLGDAYRRLARFATGARVSDFQCGAKAFPRQSWSRVRDEIEETGFAFDTELVGRFERAGYRIEEIPIEWADPGGSSVRPIRDAIGMGAALPRINRSLPTRVATSERPLRIALVSSHPPNRGHLAEYGEELASAYAERAAVEPVVFARKTPEAPKVEKADGYEIRRVWERNSPASGLRLLRELRAGNFDAVQFNIHMTYFGRSNAVRFLGLTLPGLARLVLQCPVVTTLHDMLEVIEAERVAEEIGTIEQLGARLATQLVLLSDATTVTAADYRDIIRRRYLGGEVVHVPHGTFHRGDGGVPAIEPPLRLLVFGFLGPTKDVRTTVEAFGSIRAYQPEAELVIAGDSHPDYEGYRNRLLDRFGDEPGVRFPGYIEEDELDTIWREASLVLLPYRTCTGVSGVFQLAKSYGKPVIAYDTEGMRTATVETGGAVEFVPPNDAEALADRIRRLWVDRPSLDRMARQNATAAGRVPMDETAERMLNVLERAGTIPRRTEVATGD